MHLFNMVGAWGGPIAALYENVVAAGVGPLYDALVELLSEDLPGNAEILDLGCGGGRVASRLARANPAGQVTALDLSPQQIARAHRLGADLPNLDCRVGDAMDVSLDDGSFDLAVSVASIKHWPDPAKGVSEMARVTRPGGAVWLTEADAGCTPEAAANFVNLWRLVIPGARPVARWYFRRFVAGQGMTADELSAILSDAGLADVRIQTAPDQPLLIATGAKR